MFSISIAHTGSCTPRTECECEDAVRAARVLVHQCAAHVAHGEALLQHVQHVVEPGAEALARADQQRLPAFVLPQVQLLQRQRATSTLFEYLFVLLVYYS